MSSAAFISVLAVSWAAIAGILIAILLLAGLLISVLGGSKGVGPTASDQIAENAARRAEDRNFERPPSEGDLL